MIFKRGLMILGAVFLLFSIIFYATLAYQLSHRNSKVDEKDDQDVHFVTEYFGLHQDEPVKLEHSYKSTGSSGGDYMKMFGIKIVHIEESEIDPMHGWIRGDKLLPKISMIGERHNDSTEKAKWKLQIQKTCQPFDTGALNS